MDHWVRACIGNSFEHEGDPCSQRLSSIQRIIDYLEKKDEYLFRNPELEEISYELDEYPNIKTLKRRVRKISRICGFCNIEIFILRQRSGLAFQTRLLTTYPVSWFEYYKAKSYELVDPVLRQANEVNYPFLFSEACGEHPLELTFWEDAKSHGIGCNGLCQAFGFSDGTRVGVSYSSNLPIESFNEVVALNGSDALIMADLLAQAFLNYSCGSGFLEAELTVEELRLLHRLAISDSLEIDIQDTYYEKNEYLNLRSSILSKLQVKTVLQAVAAAHANHLFDHLPYDFCDVVHVDEADLHPFESAVLE